MFGGEKQLIYRLKCTNLKKILTLVEKDQFNNLLLLKDLVIDENLTLNKGEKTSFKVLSKLFTEKELLKLRKSKSIIEIKSNNVQI